MDENQLFVVNSITRANIADDFNTALDRSEGNEEFAPDDLRLSDIVCTAYAARLGDCHGENEDELREKAEQVARDFLSEFFPHLT